MKSYEQIVERYRKYKLREMLPNDSHSHAAILFHNILQAAIDNGLDVKIVSGTLMKEFYEPLVSKIQSLLVKNRIEVILLSPEEHQLKDNKFLDEILLSSKGAVYRWDNSSGNSSHFILAGDSIYRLETDHGRGEAIANFNDKTLGDWLSNEFSELKTRSTVYSLTSTTNATGTNTGQSVQ